MRLFILYAMMCVAVRSIYAQNSAKIEIGDHLHPISKLSFNGNGDYKIFDSVLRDKRIIFLGEGHHGDGTTLKAKTELIKYLTTYLDFEVLIVELNIYEVFRMYQFLHKDFDKDMVLKEGFRHIYYLSTGTEDLRNYIKLRSRQSNFHFEGFEITYNSWYGHLIVNELKSHRLNLKKINLYKKLLDQIVNNQHCLDCENSTFDLETFQLLSNYLTANITDDFLIQVIKSNLGLAKWVKFRPLITPKTEYDIEKFMKYRDEVMAENLKYFLYEKYKDKKIVVSTSTYHMSRKLDDGPNMVDFIPDSLQKEIYYLPFISFQGSRGFVKREDASDVETYQRAENSLEGLINNFGYEYAFLDFAKFKDNKYLSSLRMYPFWDSKKQFNWIATYDGVFFIGNMVPDKWEGFKGSDYNYFKDVLYKYKGD